MTDSESKHPVAPDRIVDPCTVPFSEPSYRGVLPHLHKPGCTYFVTFCLADVAPKRAWERARILDDGEVTELAKETDLEPTVGSCMLADPNLAGIVEAALLHFQGKRYALNAWCVMPNHVHAVVTPHSDYRLSTILKSWKGFSARQVNRLRGATGTVWQRESFDHIIRSEACFEKFVEYVERNPLVAGLALHPGDWPFSSARFRPL
jgi:REP element-mobilizing transposase RayT